MLALPFYILSTVTAFSFAPPDAAVEPTSLATPTSSAVKKLDLMNFDRWHAANAANNSASVVFFYAEWCSISRQVLPAFHEAAAKVDPAVARFAQFDCYRPGGLLFSGPRFGIMSYPSIVMLDTAGVTREFGGQRSVADFVKFASVEGASSAYVGYGGAPMGWWWRSFFAALRIPVVAAADVTVVSAAMISLACIASHRAFNRHR